MAIDPTKPVMPDQGATALGKGSMEQPPTDPNAFSKPGGPDKSVSSPDDVKTKFKEKRYFNKVVHSAGALPPEHLDNLSEEGWKMIAASKHPDQPGMLYYFRRRRS